MTPPATVSAVLSAAADLIEPEYLAEQTEYALSFALKEALANAAYDRAYYETLRTALETRDEKLTACPINGKKTGIQRGEGRPICPKCGSTTQGPCWAAVSADSMFVDAVRVLISKRGGDHL